METFSIESEIEDIKIYLKLIDEELMRINKRQKGLIIFSDRVSRIMQETIKKVDSFFESLISLCKNCFLIILAFFFVHIIKYLFFT